MTELTQVQRLEQAAAGRIPDAVLYDDEGGRMYLVYSQAMAATTTPNEVLSFSWKVADGEVTEIKGRYRAFMDDLAPWIARQWPRAHILYTGCGCCQELYDLRAERRDLSLPPRLTTTT